MYIAFQISIYYANAPRNATVLRSETIIRAVDGAKWLGFQSATTPSIAETRGRNYNVSEH